tara:strand:+ start:3254 stop:4381 length:1128 start_codon:yes stop_codon:yes gene_type:complete
MNTFCHNPFIGLDINPEGHIRPCCKFLESEMPKFHIKQGIETYKKSKWVKKLQDQFIDGKRPKGCERCWKEESAGIESKRQLDYIRHKKQFDSVDLKNPNYINISLAFGNLCNLACRICSPNQSSRWASERNKLENKNFPIWTWFKDKTVMDDIYTNTKNAVHFDIPGGEPLLLEIPEHFEFLSKFSNDQAKQISLHYTTNGTNFPQDKFLKVWDRFKEIDLQISLDDVGERFEYNRWPADWNHVYSNVKRLQDLENKKTNIRLSVAFTVSVFTILYAKDFFDWCVKEGLPNPWMGRLNFPDYYSVDILPKKNIDQIRNILKTSTFDSVKNLSNYLTGSKQELIPFFQKKINDLDKTRNQSFSRTFPELKELLYE